MKAKNLSDRPDFIALAFLAAAAFLCYGGPGIVRLGFYHDDWAMLGLMHFSGPGLFAHIAALIRGVPRIFFRPFDILIYAGLFTLFGFHPLPWQLTLYGVNVLLAFAIYKLLTRYDAQWRWALLGAALFLAYPSKDATLFWPLLVINSFALLAFTIAYLLYLSYVDTGQLKFLWAALPLLLISLTTYDQCFFLPGVWLLTPRDGKDVRPRIRKGTSAAVGIAVVFFLYKFVFVQRALGIAFDKPIVFSLSHFGSVYERGIGSSIGPTLVGYVFHAAHESFVSSPWLAVLAVLLPWTICALKTPRKAEADGRDGRLILLGLAIFVLGYLPIAVSDYHPSPINHMNRLNQVPIFGFILALIGVCRISRRPAVQRAACLAASILFSAHVAFAGFWAESYREQMHVRGLIERYARQWPAGRTLLLLMPHYILQGKEYFVEGKAPVFIAHWDISGASQIWTEDPSRKADILNPWSRFFPQGIRVWPGGVLLSYESVMVLDADRGIFTKVGYDNFRIPGHDSH